MNQRVDFSCLADKVNPLLRADMLDQKTDAKLCGDACIAGDHGDFCMPVRAGDAKLPGGGTAGVDAVFPDKFRILFMKADRNAECIGLLQRLREHDLIQNGLSIISKNRSTCCSKSLQIIHLLTLHSFCDIGGAVNMNLLPAPSFQNIRQDFCRIHRRVGVRHQNDRGIPACSGSKRAGVKILFIGKTGITEMRVRIHKARRHNAPGRIKDVFCRKLSRGSPFQNPAVISDQKIFLSLEMIFGIDNGSVCNQQHSVCTSCKLPVSNRF